MSNTAKRGIALIGGTFDPVHLGHIVIAKQLQQHLSLQQIQFIPTNIPPHRDTPIADAKHRVNMLRIATADYRLFIVNDIELQYSTPSYTITMLERLRQRIPEQPLQLVIGSDVFNQFNQWRDWERIIEFAHIVVVTRLQKHSDTPASVFENPPAWMQKMLTQYRRCDSDDLMKQPAGVLFLQPIQSPLISATDIRTALSRGEDVSQQLDEGVLRYIKQHHLYDQTST